MIISKCFQLTFCLSFLISCRSFKMKLTCFTLSRIQIYHCLDSCETLYVSHVATPQLMNTYRLDFRLCMVFSGRNEVVAKVMFLHVCVILFTGGGLRADPPWQGEPPLGPGRPPSRENPPWDQADTTTPRQGDPPQHTVNERPVRILLECILVVLVCSI